MAGRPRSPGQAWARATHDVPRAAQVGGQFRRVVGVAVEHPDAVGLPLELHPPPGAAERGEAGGGVTSGKSQLDRDGEGRGGVERVVTAGIPRLITNGALARAGTSKLTPMPCGATLATW